MSEFPSLEVEVKSEDLPRVLENVEQVPELVTFGVKTISEKWYKDNFLRYALKVIVSGSPQSRIPKNVGRYRIWKIKEHGIDHGLGVISGQLYFGIMSGKMTIRETRGKEVRLSAKYSTPRHLVYVHEGTTNPVRLPRPFNQVALDNTLPILIKRLERMFDGMDLTRPYPELLRNVNVLNTSGGIVT